MMEVVNSIELRNVKKRIDDLEINLENIVKTMQDIVIIFGDVRDINQMNNAAGRDTEERIKKLERMLGKK